MRVLSALTYYAPHWTGLTGHARQLAAGLARRGHDVTVLAYQHEPALPRRERLEGVQIERVPPAIGISRGVFSPQYVMAAARLLSAHDVMLINTPMLEALPLALVARARRRPTVLVHHGDLILPAGAGNRIVERVTTASMAGAARLASRVTTYNEDYGAHSDFLLPFRPRLVAIAPPVDIPSPRPDAVARWRAELGLSEKLVIGFAGRFVEEKGGDILLRALPMVLAAEPRAHLVYAGDAHPVYERFYEYCQPLLAPVAAHVSQLGLLRDRQQLADFYSLCDVLALPSRSDCFGLVQVEAMLCGTPVVASDIPGAREAVRRTGMGRLFASCDPAALARALLETLHAPQALTRSPVEIRRAFDTERCLDAYEDLLRSAASEGGLGAPAPVRVRAQPALASFADADRTALATWLSAEPDMAYRRRLPVLLEYLALNDGERVLDAGCGAGFELSLMSALRQLRLYGVDASADALASARQRGVSVPIVNAALERLPFADNAFDKILLHEVLEHTADDEGALRELLRVLCPGGVLAISVPHADYPLAWDPLNRLWTAVGGRPIRSGPLVGIWTHHRRLYWPRDLADRVADAGFIVDQMEQATHHTLPFAHFLLYGIGRRLVAHGWSAPNGRAALATGTAPAGGMTALALRAVIAAFAAVDRRNERPPPQGQQTFVNVLLKARKPLA